MNANLHQKIEQLIALTQQHTQARQKAKRELGYKDDDEMRLDAVFKLNEKVKDDRAAVFQFLDGLSADERREICAIMFLGRGDFDSYGDSLNHCKTIDTAAGYIQGKGSNLEKYLREGMAKL